MNMEISSSDQMFDGSDERYFSVGASALEAIRQIVGGSSVSSILDIPCGHGRVARHMRNEWPSADMFVSDLNKDGMDFCARTFDAVSLPSSEDFDKVDFGRKFELIWVGSLITHLSAEDTRKFFRFLERHLSPDGIAVVTSHGELVGGRLKEKSGWMYGLPTEDQAAIYAEAEESGYGYRRYPGWKVEYGISLSTREWLVAAAKDAGLIMTQYLPSAWDNHQDVFGLKLS
ncbi:class I SAM-dependent methyltransferase [Rhizobium rhizogenes]|uniref:Methyltransferase domain-containing protein n=1 Tax=Rhizobium rhizogenes NBRC 13257 TaxID=1220581 RepID=A0AA87Q591_RHIRH|nr:class I SAM-dependent methyltransferase [Rhizobium rhizogenes]NTG68862.1 class I SAM-dependent methyltransferase [Rhizobium rhizogenes]NTH53041.1 class I SAM-dependent methyltransferase [Rhizobium rhizogenes]NTH72625.1 class I SAM-dependent methyltransferase [Rhizobium rhizogenes]NTI69670.1 class I SAM-dependent methyltransferase [Rhizobium rhizogenes]TRB04565.1 class I SAM-dependent methyltransferase [Rhizobium rhizogenes]